MSSSLRHVPVLAAEIFAELPPHPQKMFDGTFGHGGHVEYFLSRLTDTPQVVVCDLDQKIMEKGLAFTQQWKGAIIPVLASYAEIDQLAEQYGTFDFALLDLGVNLEHFKDGTRGFSIKTDAPLDMRFRNDGKLRAADLIAHASKEQLANLLMEYGDFSAKSAHLIGTFIVEKRKKSPIRTTLQLSSLLSQFPLSQKQIAVVFQALRIETNQELLQLEIFLKKLSKVISSRGRCAIISYHSIEDRMVKTAFKSLCAEGEFRLVHKKVIMPSWQEIQKNKAARSAKLRIIERSSAA